MILQRDSLLHYSILRSPTLFRRASPAFRRSDCCSPIRCRTSRRFSRILPPCVIVSLLSKMQECGLPTMSMRDERLVAVFENAFVTLARRRLLEGGVDRIDRRVLFQDRGEIGHRTVRRRDAKRAAVQLSFQRRNHFADRLGRAGARRNDADRGRARAPQIFMREDRECAGRSCNCGSCS